MKIAIVNRHPDDFFGGSEMQCDNIASGLCARNHDVVYIAPAGRSGHDYKRVYKIVPTQSNALSIAEATLAEKPDMVYWRLNKYHFHDAVKKFAQSNIPVVFAISHISDTKPWSARENPRKGLIPFLQFLKQGLENLYNHRGYRYVSGIASNNPDFLNILPVEKQKFIPNSVDMEATPFLWPRPYIVWVANIKPHKQPELFVRLAKTLADKGIDFLMVGDIQSAQFDWIRTEHDRLPSFHYLGPKPLHDATGIIAGSLLLVHTCKPEGFGNNFIQAWLLGKPTVSYAFDPASLIQKHDLGGFPNSDWDLFVKQVARLIDDPGARQAAGGRALAMARENFSVDRTVRELEAFLKECFPSL